MSGSPENSGDGVKKSTSSKRMTRKPGSLRELLTRGTLAASAGLFAAGDGSATRVESQQSKPSVRLSRALLPSGKSRDFNRRLTNVEKVRLMPIRERYDRESVKGFFDSMYWQNLPPPDKVLFFEDLFTPTEILSGEEGDGGGDGESPLRIMLEARRTSGWMKHMHDAYIPLLRRALYHWGPNHLLEVFLEEPRLAVLPSEEALVREAFTHPNASSALKIRFIKKARVAGEYLNLMGDLLTLLRPEEMLVYNSPDPGLDDIHDPFTTFIEARSIYKDDALKGAKIVQAEDLPEDLHGLRYKELADWRVMIARNLYFRNKEVTPENVRDMAEQIKEQRQRLRDYPIFGNTLFVAHEELWRDGQPRFGRKKLIESIKRVSPSFEFVSPHIDRMRNNFLVTKYSLAAAAKKTLARIITTPASTSAHFTFYANAHGGGEGNGAIYLSDGQIKPKQRQRPQDGGGNNRKERDAEGQQVVETERTRKLTAEQIASAFIRRYKDPAKRRMALARPDVIILDSCYSSNIIRAIAGILTRARAPLPIMIAAAEYDQYSYSDEREFGGDFAKNTILQTSLGRDHIPTMGGIFLFDDMQRNSNPVVFIPGPDGTMMQVSEAEWFEDSGVQAG